MPPKKYVGPRSTAAAPTATPPARRRVEKERTEGMTNAEWAFDLQRRQVENASRRQRELRAKKKRASEAMAAEVSMAQRAAHMAGMPTFPPQAAGTYNPTAWGSQTSVSSLSPSSATTQVGLMSQDSLGTP
jgi:hypothetical protein